MPNFTLPRIGDFRDNTCISLKCEQRLGNKPIKDHIFSVFMWCVQADFKGINNVYYSQLHSLKFSRHNCECEIAVYLHDILYVCWQNLLLIPFKPLEFIFPVGIIWIWPSCKYLASAWNSILLMCLTHVCHVSSCFIFLFPSLSIMQNWATQKNKTCLLGSYICLISGKPSFLIILLN